MNLIPSNEYEFSIAEIRCNISLINYKREQFDIEVEEAFKKATREGLSYFEYLKLYEELERKWGQ